jgi:hypothetical protein
VCSVCMDAPSVSCSTCLRGVHLGLPSDVPALHAHLHKETDWSERLSPGMMELMKSLLNLANAAISEFESPHLAGQLTPDALMALSVIAETMIDSALQRQREHRQHEKDG